MRAFIQENNAAGVFTHAETAAHDKRNAMLRIDIEPMNAVTTLYCEGRLIYGVETETLRTMTQSRTERNIRIDLSQVSQIDASGLGLLIELQLWAAHTHRTVTFVDLSAEVWRMVILTKLYLVLEISYSDLAATNIPD